MRTVRALSVAAIAFYSTTAGGQTSSPCARNLPSRGGPGTIVGTVRDTAHRAIDSVEVFITSPRRQTASANGAFRLDRLDKDSYEVTARRIGYEPQTLTIAVGDSGGVAAFCLVPTTVTLDPVISSAPRIGLMGIVADTAYAGIRGAEISVLGGYGDHAVSDSAGMFFIPLKSGRYMVRVKRAGFAPRMVSISIPPDSGRKLLIWLYAIRGRAALHDEWAARELGFRLDTAIGAWSKVFTREDIINFPSDELTQLARAGAVAAVDDNCPALIDGGPITMPLWSLRADDLEMVEVYTDKPPRGTTRTSTRCPHIYAWLRK